MSITITIMLGFNSTSALPMGLPPWLSFPSELKLVYDRVWWSFTNDSMMIKVWRPSVYKRQSSFRTHPATDTTQIIVRFWVTLRSNTNVYQQCNNILMKLQGLDTGQVAIQPVLFWWSHWASMLRWIWPISSAVFIPFRLTAFKTKHFITWS